MIFAVRFLIISLSFFLKLVLSITWSLKDSQKLSIQPLSLYASCLSYMHLSDDIVDIEKPDGICSPSLVVDEFSELFLNQSIVCIKHPISA